MSGRSHDSAGTVESGTVVFALIVGLNAQRVLHVFQSLADLFDGAYFDEALINHRDNEARGELVAIFNNPHLLSGRLNGLYTGGDLNVRSIGDPASDTKHAREQHYTATGGAGRSRTNILLFIYKLIVCKNRPFMCIITGKGDYS